MYQTTKNMDLYSELKNIISSYGNSEPVLTIEVEGIIFPCPRPRVTRGRDGRSHIYYPDDYVDCKTLIIDCAKIAMYQAEYQPVEAGLVLIKFYGVEQIGPRSSRDGDNMMKSVFDGITEAGVFLTDTLATIPMGLYYWIPECLENKTEIIVYETARTDHKKIRKINKKARR